MSFKDTFTRGDSGENKLKYDDTAFFFFFLAVGSVVSAPLIISILKPLFVNPSRHIIKNSCKCEDCKIKSQIIYKQVKHKYLTKGYFFKIVFQICLLYLLFLAQQAISQTPQMKYFDPYETLEIERGIDEKEIKSAYRRLTKIWHPDKNPAADAQEKFILLTKAYECLTDETKKHICEKYGNPDGPGAMQVAIAMPSFLLKKENHVSVLAMFFVAMFIILPTTFYCCTENLGKYDEHGIYIQNKGLFYLFLNEQLLISKCPELLANCREYQLKIKANNTYQESDLQKLNSKNLAQCFKSVFDKQWKIPQQSWIPYIIMSAYLLGEDIPESLQHEAHIVISEAPQITQSVINFMNNTHIAFTRKNVPIQMNPYRYKFMGYSCLRTLIEFQQNICAGQWICKGKNVIEIAQNQIKAILTDPNRKQHAYPEFEKLLKAYHENSQMLFKPKKLNKRNEEQQPQEYDKEELELLEKLKFELSLLPQIQVTYACGTDEENESTDRDVLDLKITLKILNFKKIQNNYAHLIRYYGQRINRWHVIVTNDRDEILHYQLLGGQKDTLESSYKFQEFNVGKNKLIIVIKSDTYKGYDQDIPVEFEILDHRKVKREIFIHPEDKELDNQPSFMQQYILGGKAVNASDEEEEEEDENEETDKKKKNKKDKKYKDENLNEDENQDEQSENLQDNKNQKKEINLNNSKTNKNNNADDEEEEEEEEKEEEEETEIKDKKQK